MEQLHKRAGAAESREQLSNSERQRRLAPEVASEWSHIYLHRQDIRPLFMHKPHLLQYSLPLGLSSQFKRGKNQHLNGTKPARAQLSGFMLQQLGIIPYKAIAAMSRQEVLKWLLGEALQIAVKRREVKSKGEKKRYKHLNAEFKDSKER